MTFIFHQIRVYSYSIIPVNEEDIVGPYFKTDPHCTMSIISDLVFLDVSTASITISLQGFLSFFDVYRLDLSIYTRSAINIVDLPADLTEPDIIANATLVGNGIDGNTFYDFSYNMVSNSPYSYIIVSYNQFFDLPGSDFYTTNYTFTLAILRNAEVLGIIYWGFIFTNRKQSDYL
jgi:hypothetical protein